MFPVTQCDDAVEEVGDQEFIITGDLDACCWQAKLNDGSKEKTAFFTPEGKKHWNALPMGIKNAHPFFVAMILDFKQEWKHLFSEKQLELIEKTLLLCLQLSPEVVQKHMALGMKNTQESIAKNGNPGSVIIVDDITWFAKSCVALLAHFVRSLSVLHHCRVTVNLRKVHGD